MHDKQIRRRRAVLVLLVVISLAFSPTTSENRRAARCTRFSGASRTVLSPLQSGASTVLSPVRDVAGYVSSTINAKSQLPIQARERQADAGEFARRRRRASQNKQAGLIGKLDRATSLQSYGPKEANVIGENPSLWYKTIKSTGAQLRRQGIRPGGGARRAGRRCLDGHARTVGRAR